MRTSLLVINSKIILPTLRGRPSDGIKKLKSELSSITVNSGKIFSPTNFHKHLLLKNNTIRFKRTIFDEFPNTKNKTFLTLLETYQIRKQYTKSSRIVKCSPIEKYQDDAKLTDKKKIECNAEYVKLTKLVDRSNKIIILDGKHGVTSSNLRHVGISKLNIMVPNFDQSTCNEINKLHYSTAICSTLGYFLNNTPLANKVSSAWFDYCCTFTGNQKLSTTPEQDIRTYFEEKMAINGSVFGVTFSHRSNVSQDEVINKIIEIGHLNGYTLNIVFQKNLQRVYTVFFIVRKLIYVFCKLHSNLSPFSLQNPQILLLPILSSIIITLSILPILLFSK